MTPDQDDLQDAVHAAAAARDGLLLLLSQTWGLKRPDVETFLQLLQAMIRAEVNGGLAAYQKAFSLPRPDH